MGGRGYGGGGGRVYTYRYIVTTRMTYIKMGSDESHFNVSVASDGQSHKTVSINHNLSKKKERTEAVSNRGPTAYQPNAFPLGQTVSRPALTKRAHYSINHRRGMITHASINALLT